MAGGVFSGAKLNAMTIRESANDGSDFTSPDADYRRLFLGEDGLLHVKDSSGTVTSPYSGGGLDEGTAFPGSPAADDLFYRTDRNLIYFYDGTRWLTVHEYTLPLIERANMGAAGYNATSTVGNAPTRGAAGDMWIEDFRVTAFASAALFDGSNFWVVTLDKLTSANVATNIGSLTFNSLALNNWLNSVDAVDEVVSGAAHVAFRVIATKTGASAGNLICGIEITYRLVG